MKKLVLFLCVASTILFGCSGDDSSPVNEPAPPNGQPSNQKNILVIQHDYMPLYNNIRGHYRYETGSIMNLTNSGSQEGSRRYVVSYTNKIMVENGKRFVFIEAENSNLEIEMRLNGQTLVKQLEKLKNYKLFLSTGTDDITMESFELVN